MALECEYKWLIPDGDTMAALRDLRALPGWRMDALPPLVITDHYVDTPERALLQHGYACRVRRQGDRQLLSVKSFGDARDGYHVREEVEAPFTGSLEHGVPDNPAGERIRALVGEVRLQPLFTLVQHRSPRRIWTADRPLAELTIDTVVLTRRDGRECHLAVAELECLPDCDHHALAALQQALTARVHLVPTDESKFHWAMRQIAAMTAEGT